MNVDPLVEKTGTPYAYTYNNPIRFIDPTGMEPETICCPPIPAPIPLLPPPILHNPEQGVIITGTPVSLPSKESIVESFNKVKDVAIATITIKLQQEYNIAREGFDIIKSLSERVLNNDNNSVQKGGGKNAQHANQKAKQSAAEKYKEIKIEHDKLKSKPNKTKEDSKEVERLKKQLEHWKKKADETGENHSRNAKGNR